MTSFSDTVISRGIIQRYHDKLLAGLESDALIVGAGPAGLVAAGDLADAGLRVTILEKRLAPGGGIWGGGMTMNEAVVQEDAVDLLDEMNIRYSPFEEGLYTVDTIEMASVLCARAVQKGVNLFNVTTVEDVAICDERVCGAVANRTMVYGHLPVDPITFSGRAVIDATGHDAAVLAAVRRRGLLTDRPGGGSIGEGPMNATEGEAFVVDQVMEIFPGLWVAGMSVCSALGGPRMGPIFGGMLLSGRRVADQVRDALV